MNLQIDSLSIGALIRDRLERIMPVYPCAAPETAPAEFCVYRRAGFTSRDTKDRFNYQETVNMVVSMVAPTYSRSLELAQAAKTALDGVRGSWMGLVIDGIWLTNAVEDYGDNAYMQHLYFAIVLDTTKGT